MMRRELSRKDGDAGHDFYHLDAAIFCAIRTVREILRWIEVRKMLDTVVSLAVCVGLLIYLVYAMLRPEKF
ncbi:MAG: K(+)-transporting ATPase subunit F [Candidatus Acidiferrales bacterium]